MVELYASVLFTVYCTFQKTIQTYWFETQGARLCQDEEMDFKALPLNSKCFLKRKLFLMECKKDTCITT